jgi:hypothetical protein
MIFLAPVKCFLVEISRDQRIIIPMKILKFNIIALISVSKKLGGEKNQARFGSVFETIKLGSARLAG